MRELYLISTFIHLLAMMIWMGGMIFLALVVIPVTREKMFRSLSSNLIRRTGERFRPVAWICLFLLLISGILMLFARGYTWGDFTGRLWQGDFGFLLAHKLGLFGIILLLSAFHDFYLGPKASRLLSSDHPGAEAGRYRKFSSWMGRINLLLGLLVIILGIMLIRGMP